MKVSEVLEKAADLLEEKGWNRGAEIRPDGSMCARGAIKMAMDAPLLQIGSPVNTVAFIAFMEPELRSRYLEAVRWLQKAIGISETVDVAYWNDWASRQKDDVVTALRHAAKFAKEDEDESF